MAFDGSAVSALINELNNTLEGGRISKIAQPEKDELLLTVKTQTGLKRLFMSASPSLPLVYLTNDNRTAPLNAPAFCMLLRKHIQGGKIISITQPSMERIINVEIEHYSELGDICRKILTVELMGKHSNIIFREGTKILDSIRHVSALVSSVREVLPGREYFIPFGNDKLDPFNTGFDEFEGKVCKGSLPLYKSIYTNITGFSPALAEEVVFNASLDDERSSESLTIEEALTLYRSFSQTMNTISEKEFSPAIIYENDVPTQFVAFTHNIYNDLKNVHYDSMSLLLESFYSEKQQHSVMAQKTSALRQTVQNLLARNYKKYDLQRKQIKDSEKREKYRLYGELLTAYGYSADHGASSFTCNDFYSGNEITIPLDPTLSAIENGKRYFEKYTKLKRTAESLDTITKATEEEISHLESVMISLDTAKNEADIADIRLELVQAGYIKGSGNGKKSASKAVRSAPLHYVSSDGFHMYVGKNNYQNEYITFKLADGNDWWFHAKRRPGSHVIVKCEGKDITDHTFEEAASLAAHYCKSSGDSKIEVDYIQRKHVKKPGGAKPGFVIYHTNYSMTAGTDISAIQEI